MPPDSPSPMTPHQAKSSALRWSGSVPALVLLKAYLLLLLLIPNEQVFAPLGSAGTPATIAGLGFLLWWVLTRLSGGARPTRHVNPLHFALGLLLVAAVLSYALGLASGWIRPLDIRQETDALISELPVRTSELQEKSVLGATRGLITICSWAGVALVIMDGLRSRDEVREFVDWLVWLTAVVAAIGIYQYITGDNLARLIQVPGLSADEAFGVSIQRADLNRVSASATHPLEFSAILAAVIPFAIHRALYPRRAAERPSTRRRSISDVLPAILLLVATPMAVSRTGILALLISFTVLFVGWPNSRRIGLLIIAPLALIVMRSALPGLLGTIRDLMTQALGDPSVQARTTDYAVVLDIYARHPWFGRGPFTFIPQYYRTLDNQYLMNLVELGAVGLVATVGFFLCGFYLATYVKRHAITEEDRHLGLAAAAAILAIASTYFAFDAWGFGKAGAVSFVLLGIAGAAWRHTTGQDAGQPVSTMR